MPLPPIFFTIIVMPRNYWGEAKIKFPLPSYPKEDAFEDSAKYEAAVDGFGLDCQQVLTERSTWVDHETIADLARKSEAACARAADDKKRHEGEEKKEGRDERLIGAVQALTAALSNTDLVVDSAQGRVVGGVGKGGSAGKGKGRADPESSAEESDDEDAEGEGEGSGGGDD